MRSPQRILVVVVAAAAAALAGATIWLSTKHETHGPAGAELLADGDGPESLGAAWVGHVDLDDLTLDDLPMEGTNLVRAAADGDIILQVETDLDAYLVRTSATGQVGQVGSVILDGSITAFNVAPDGEYARVRGAEMYVTPGEWHDIWTTVDAPFEVGAVDLIGNESVIVGSRDGPYVDAVTPDGTSRRLLGPADDPEARVTIADPLGPIVSLVDLGDLGDERIAFVADTADGYQLYLLDDHTVAPIDTDTPRSNPVRSPGSLPTDGTTRRDRRPMTPLAPGPDGRLVAIGIGPQGDPVITLVDPDTGELEPLATLDGVEPSIAEPISAAVAGDDLIFTAKGSIWRLADAVEP